MQNFLFNFSILIVFYKWNLKMTEIVMIFYLYNFKLLFLPISNNVGICKPTHVLSQYLGYKKLCRTIFY